MERRVYSLAARCDYTFRMRGHTKRRLAENCFRGRDLRAAGNLCRWDDEDALFEDKTFVELLLAACHEALRGVTISRNGITRNVEVEYPQYVGWSSTAPIDSVSSRVLERYEPNPYTVARRVQPSATAVLAPRTKLLTLAVEFRRARGGIEAIVHTIYPGPNIGALRRDPGDQNPQRLNVTEREGVVFFDWNHPGERLAAP